MPRPWKRRAVFEGNRLVTLKKLIRSGTSFCLVIPKDYVRYWCPPDAKGDRWAKVEWDYETGKITIEGYELEVGH